MSQNESQLALDLFDQIASLEGDAIKPNDPAWGSRDFYGGTSMSADDFNAIRHAAHHCGDFYAYLLEVESLNHEFRPLKVPMEYVDFEKINGELMSHFDCVLVSPSGSWFAALYNDLRTVVYGDERFMEALSERYLSQ